VGKEVEGLDLEGEVRGKGRRRGKKKKILASEDRKGLEKKK